VIDPPDFEEQASPVAANEAVPAKVIVSVVPKVPIVTAPPVSCPALRGRIKKGERYITNTAAVERGDNKCLS
jgi:hypothetical protein